MARNKSRLIKHLQGESGELLKEIARLEAEVKTKVNQVLNRISILEYNLQVRTLLRTTEVMLTMIENEVIRMTIAVEQAKNYILSCTLSMPRN